MFDLDTIRAAETNLKGRFRRTELIYSHHFSERLGYPLFFKCENLQRTGSFKIRGALNFLDKQPPELLQNGLITASAGNHAQGVAFAGISGTNNLALYKPARYRGPSLQCDLQGKGLITQAPFLHKGRGSTCLGA